MVSKQFMKKLKLFTNNKVNFSIKWMTKKVKHIFKVKDRNPHPLCCIYKGTCSCSMTYIGETKRNASLRWREHSKPTEKSEPAKHLLENPQHEFQWEIIKNAPKNTRLRKTIEAFIIAINKPSLNEQKDNNLLLFRNGIT